MSVSYFPVGYTPTGDFTVSDGGIRSFYYHCDANQNVDRVWFISPRAQTVAAALYGVGGGGGGDGDPLWSDTGLVCVEGLNEFIFDGPVPHVAGNDYMAAVAIPAGGGTAFVNNADLEELVGPPFSWSTPYWNAYVLDTAVLPAEAVSDGGRLILSPWAQSLNFYGVGVGYQSLPSRITFTARRVDDTHVEVDWTLVGDAPDGYSVFRCPGSHLGLDGEGRDPDDDEYDARTIDGVMLLAEFLTEGPYVDEVTADPDGWTYWVYRSLVV